MSNPGMAKGFVTIKFRNDIESKKILKMPVHSLHRC
jgi:hypothetical protein